ncbi:MAG: AMP-binding protein [Deltaproteobacteria bacterium]
MKTPNLATAIIGRLGCDPGRRLLFVAGPDGQAGHWLSRGQLLDAAAAWHQHFTACGLTPGARVALCPPRDLQLPALHLGALWAGLSVVPLNPSLSKTETASVLEAARPALIIGPEDRASAPPRSLLPSPPRSGDGNQEALVIFTSGTTGKPKGVPHSHAALVWNLETLARLWRLDAHDRLLHMLPAHHFHGLVLALYGALMAGAEIVMLPSFTANTALAAITTHRISVVMGVPTMYRRMLETADSQHDIGGLRLALCGSAPLSPALWQAFKDRFGIGLVERYGLTETGIITSNPPDHPRPGSVGRPLSGATIAIRNDNDYCLPTAGQATARGEICIAAPSVTRRYDGDPEATAAAIHHGYFHSGDLGSFDEDGYLKVDGRIKELIIVGGSNVIPGEVERVLQTAGGTEELVVAGQADPDLGEIVVAYVVAAKDSDPQDVEAGLRAAAEDGLAAYKRPRRYTFVHAIARNAMGKVDRTRLG